MPSTRLMLAVTVLSSFILAQVPAAASGQETPAKTKVLPLRVSSNKLAAEELAGLTDAVVSKLKKYPGLEVLAVPTADPMDMMVDAGCTDFDSTCLATIGKGAGADKVLYTEVSDKEGGFVVQLRLVDVKTQETKAPEGGTEVKEKLAPFLGVALEKIFGAEPSKEPVLVRVDVQSEPAGAEVYIDKEFVGLSPVTLRLKPGKYGLRLAKVGAREVIDTIVVEGDRPVTRMLTLVAIEQPKPPVEPVKPKKEREVAGQSFYQTWWFWTAVGAVVVGGVTTGVVLAKMKKTESTPGVSGLRFNSDWAPWDHAVINK